MGDSDYHLVLQDDQSNAMVAEIPSPASACVGANSPSAPQIASTHAKLDTQCTAISSFQTANVPEGVTRIGFLDFFHHQRGTAPIEVHAVLSLIRRLLGEF
jgi:hypothetical protein